jgi:hypothetical protein
MNLVFIQNTVHFFMVAKHEKKLISKVFYALAE